MAKLKLKPTLEESFTIGHLEGQKEAFTEIQEIVSGDFSIITLKSYLKARVKTLQSTLPKFRSLK